MTRKKLSNLNHCIGWVLFLLFLTYFSWSLALLIQNYSTLGAKGFTLNFFALIFEVFGPFYAIYFMVQLLDGLFDVGKVEHQLEELTMFPLVDVVMPIHNVNPIILEETLKGFQSVTYPNFNLWVADDSTNKTLAEKCQALTVKYNYQYFYQENQNFKAGMLNLILPTLKGKYVALFDVDHLPTQEIITKFVTILEHYSEFAFVQARYSFRNVQNPVQVWQAMSQYQFFLAEAGKRRLGTVLFCGTTACFRREFSYPLPEGKLLEDFEHTITLTGKGLKGYWLNEFGAHSLLPESFDHMMSQMFRWTKGQTAVAIYNARKLLGRGKSLRKAFDFLITSTLVFVVATMYITGFFYALLYLCKVPVIRPANLDQLAAITLTLLIWLIYGIIFTITTYYTKKICTFKLTFWHVIFYMIIGGLTTPFLLLPTFLGLLGQNKLKKGKISWNKKIPLLVIAFIITVFGLIFLALTTISIVDYLGIITWYPTKNFFFSIFGVIAPLLLGAIPFVVASRQLCKKSHYYKDENIYH